jgi:sugar O-acyltransferase (sialic acid O-acetyltransferase NeuD family)
MAETFVYGASGHGKVVADILLSCKSSTLRGFIDDNDGLRGTLVLGLPVLGNSKWLQERARSGLSIYVALGIGDNSIRKRVAEGCRDIGIEMATIVHPSAHVSTFANIGSGSVVMAQAAINPGASIGEGVIVNTSSSIDHDVVMGDFSHAAPNSCMGGNSRLGRLSHLGLGASVIQGVTIGERTVIGAGAVVVRDIPDDVVAVGVPARIQRILSNPT